MSIARTSTIEAVNEGGAVPEPHEQGRFALTMRDDGADLQIAGILTCALTTGDLADLRTLLAEVETDGAVRPSPPPSVPTPATIIRQPPRPAPVFSTVTGDPEEAEDPALSPESIDVLPGVRPFLARFGLDREDLASIVNDPEDEWLDYTGTKSIHLGEHHAVVLGLGDETVVSVIPRARALREKPRNPGVPRGHGGAGTRYPTSMGELETMLAARGATITYVGSGHKRVDANNASATLTTTPGDYRSLRNTITQLESKLGLDLTRS